MKSRAIELYHELRKINSHFLRLKNHHSVFIPSKINHLSRYLGSELDRSIKLIIKAINDSKNHTALLKIDVNQNSKSKIKFEFNASKEIEKNKTYEKFDLEKYLESYDFQSAFKYGIQNKEEIVLCQKHLTNMLRTIDFKKFDSDTVSISRFKIYVNHRLSDVSYGHGDSIIQCSPDLIIDNRLIEIKSDVNPSGRKNANIAQLLFYFFLIQLYIESSEFNKNGNTKLPDIKKIGVFYSSHDRLIESDIVDLIPNKVKILNLLKHEITFGNFFIKDIIEKSLLVKTLNELELENLEKKIIKRKDKLYRLKELKIIDRNIHQIKLLEYISRNQENQQAFEYFYKIKILKLENINILMSLLSEGKISHSVFEDTLTTF